MTVDYENGVQGWVYHVEEPIEVREDTVEFAYEVAVTNMELLQLSSRNLPVLFVEALIDLYEHLSEEAAREIYKMKYEAKTTTDNTEMVYVD